MLNFSLIIYEGEGGSSHPDSLEKSNNVTSTELETPLLIHCLIATYITFSVIIAGLNVLNITAILTSPELKTVTNLYVLSLSSADLLLSPTLVLVHFLEGTPQCLGVLGARVTASILLSLMFTSSAASLLSILAIAVDRYCAVLHPYNYRQLMTSRRATIAILVIWAYSVIFTFTLISYYIAKTPSAIFVALSMLSVIMPFEVYLGAVVSQIVIILVVSVGLYIRIFIAIRKRHETSLVLRGRNPQTETVESRRVTHTMALVLGALIISWTPYTLLSVTVTQDAMMRHNWLVYIASGAILLLYSNSFMNPIIYASRSAAFRKAYWRMACYLCTAITRKYKQQSMAQSSPGVKTTRTTVSLEDSHSPSPTRLATEL